MTWICGVEEAGRGPVIGPMVMACLWTQDEELLRRIGAKDSKQLSPVQREDIFEKLVGLKDAGKIGFTLAILTPQEIDAAVEGTSDNLNLLELRTSARLINEGFAQAKIEQALIDCPTRSTEKYGAAIAQLLEKPIKVIAENKADENYPVVGAASIIAKVTRDRLMIELANEFPHYGFEQHKGYCTELHLAALNNHGPTPHHRRSFAPVAAREVLTIEQELDSRNGSDDSP